MIVFLDSGPLGLLTNPNSTQNVLNISNWVSACIAARHTICIPEIIDYELRREFTLMNKFKSLTRLDGYREQLEFVTIKSETMILASRLWADARRVGKPTASPAHLDIDVILAAQALTAAPDAIIATSNIDHLSRFTTSRNWEDITP